MKHSTQGRACSENFVALYDRGGRRVPLLSIRRAGDDAREKCFLELFDALSRAKAGAFWETIVTRGAALDWSLHLLAAEALQAVRMFGVLVDEYVLIIAVSADAGSPQQESYDDLSGIINELSVVHRQAAQNAKMLRRAVDAERKSLDEARIMQSRLQFLARSAAACAQNLGNVTLLVREALTESLPALGQYAGIEFGADATPRIAQMLCLKHDRVENFAPSGKTVGAEIAARAKEVISLPLHLRNARLGEISFGRNDTAYTDDERASAEQFANIVSVALDNAMRYESERSVSEHLQRASLPEALPASERFDIDATYIPSAEGPRFIGGDWYDSFILPGGDLAFSIGDVTGHGLRAATTMAKIRSAVRVAALNSGDPAEVLSRVHRFVSFEDVLATAIFARLHSATCELEYAVAGHPPPMRESGGSVTLLKGGGTPLGLDIDGRCAPSVHRVTLQRGDRITLYTDGLVEATRNIDDGLSRLMFAAAACSAVHVTAQKNVRALVDAVLEGTRALDDIAVLQVRVL